MTDLKGLLNVGKQKLGYDAEELKACLETDSTNIDDEDIFSSKVCTSGYYDFI